MLGLMLGLVPVIFLGLMARMHGQECQDLMAHARNARIFLGLMARMHGSECRDILGKESASLSASAPLSGLSAWGPSAKAPGTSGSPSEPGWLLKTS